MSAPHLLPDSLFGRILREYGIEWTHLALFAGVAISTFGLEAYLNPGIWFLASIAGFAAVYPFRSYVPASFPRVFAVAVAAIVIVAAVTLTATAVSATGSIKAQLRDGRDGYTALAALATSGAWAVLAISYRRAESLRGFAAPFPSSLQASLDELVLKQPFYRSDLKYVIEVLKVDVERLLIRTTLTYQVTNRGVSPGVFTAEFVTPRGEGKFIEAEVGGTPVDTTDAYYRGDRGLRIQRDLEPSKTLPVRFVAEEWFNVVDSELFTSYYPSTDYEIRVQVGAGCPVHFNMETLLGERVDPQRGSDGSLHLRYPGGLLPFQGVRLHWRPTDRLAEGAELAWQRT